MESKRHAGNPRGGLERTRATEFPAFGARGVGARAPEAGPGRPKDLKDRLAPARLPAASPIARAADVPRAERWLLATLVKEDEGFMSRHVERRVSLAISPASRRERG